MRSPRERSTSLSASKKAVYAWVHVETSKLETGDRVEYTQDQRTRVRKIQSVHHDGARGISTLLFLDGGEDTFDALRYIRTWRPVTIGMPCTVRVGSDLYAGKVEHVTPAGQKIVARGESFFKKADGSYQRRSKRLILGYAEDYMDPHF